MGHFIESIRQERNEAKSLIKPNSCYCGDWKMTCNNGSETWPIDSFCNFFSCGRSWEPRWPFPAKQPHSFLSLSLFNLHGGSSPKWESLQLSRNPVASRFGIVYGICANFNWKEILNFNCMMQPFFHQEFSTIPKPAIVRLLESCCLTVKFRLNYKSNTWTFGKHQIIWIGISLKIS